MLDETALAHLLTPEERTTLDRDGFTVIRQAVPPELLAALDRLADRELEAFRAARAGERGLRYASLNLHDLIGRAPEYLELVDLPTAFPKVWGVLGWNIQLFHTQLVVTPPSHPDAPPGGFGWHQDNNRMNLDFETPPPHPRVSVKLGYFLSDAFGPGMANLCVVPGSHTRGRPVLATGEQPDGAVELTGLAGDAVLFDRRIWHSASTNHSEHPRKMLFYGYSYRWLRPKSAMDLPELLASVDPIRRQLLGGATGANGYFDPQPDDVPLREWIRLHCGEPAVAP